MKNKQSIDKNLILFVKERKNKNEFDVNLSSKCHTHQNQPKHNYYQHSYFYFLFIWYKSLLSFSHKNVGLFLINWVHIKNEK